MLSSMLASRSCKILWDVDLNNSANFERDDSCDLLADLLASASNLHKINIFGHQGREVSLFVSCADSIRGTPGDVEVTDLGFGTKVTRETIRTMDCLILGSK